jgi:hypothetical protein
MNKISEKCCLNCGSEVKGRSDKKYCDDQCRSNFNNRIYASALSTVRNINHILKRNRQVLVGFINGNKSSKVSSQVLMQKGFNPGYYTHTQVTSKGAEFRICYDVAFRILDGNMCHIVECKAANEAQKDSNNPN